MPVAKDDKLLLCSNGDVEDFDPGAIECELERLRQPGFNKTHCLPLGDDRCIKCTMMACPF